MKQIVKNITQDLDKKFGASPASKGMELILMVCNQEGFNPVRSISHKKARKILIRQILFN